MTKSKNQGTPVEQTQENPKEQPQNQEAKQPVKETPQGKQPEGEPMDINPLEARPKGKNNVDVVLYEKYVGLKFLELSGAKLNPETDKELNKLEKELKAMAGRKPIRTVNAAIGNELVKLVKDIPVPEKIEEIIVDAGHAEYYFGE